MQTEDIQPPAPPRNMKIATLHLLDITQDSSASFIPSRDVSLGDKCEGSHSFPCQCEEQTLTLHYCDLQQLRVSEKQGTPPNSNPF